jgi:hypothetical protein
VRTFELQRDEDPTGISGTGKVAEGIEFEDGTVAIRWLSERRSTVFHENIDNVYAIHGHKGMTRIVWVGEGVEFDDGSR